MKAATTSSKHKRLPDNFLMLRNQFPFFIFFEVIEKGGQDDHIRKDNSQKTINVLAPGS